MKYLKYKTFHHFFFFLFSKKNSSQINIRTSIKFKIFKKKKPTSQIISRILKFCKIWVKDCFSTNAFFFLNFKILKFSFIFGGCILVAKKVKKLANKFRKKKNSCKRSKILKIFYIVQLNKKKMILWEFLNNFFSILPKIFLKKPKYGEKILDTFQFKENIFFDFFTAFQIKKNIIKDFLKVIRKIFENSNYLSYFEHIKFGLFVPFFKNLLKFFLKFSSLFPNNKIKLPNKIKLFPINFQEINFLTQRKKKTGLKIFTSCKHGWGLFSSKTIEKLVVLEEYRGKKIKNWEEFLLEIFYRFTGLDLFFFQLNKENILDATFSGNSTRLINHSCDPACFSRCVKHGFKNSIIILSLQKISCFEELSYDYKINFDEFENEELICCCFGVFCRKTLEIN